MFTCCWYFQSSWRHCFVHRWFVFACLLAHGFRRFFCRLLIPGLTFCWVKSQPRFNNLWQKVLDRSSVVFGTISRDKFFRLCTKLWTYFTLEFVPRICALTQSNVSRDITRKSPNPFLLYVCWRLEDIMSILAIINVSYKCTTGSHY